LKVELRHYYDKAVTKADFNFIFASGDTQQRSTGYLEKDKPYQQTFTEERYCGLRSIEIKNVK